MGLQDLVSLVQQGLGMRAALSCQAHFLRRESAVSAGSRMAGVPGAGGAAGVLGEAQAGRCAALTQAMENAQALGYPGPCPHTLAYPSVGGAGAGISKSGIQHDLSGLLHPRGGSTPA